MRVGVLVGGTAVLVGVRVWVGVRVLVGTLVGVRVEVGGGWVLVAVGGGGVPVGVWVGTEVGVYGAQTASIQLPPGQSSSPQHPLTGTQPNPLVQQRCPSAQQSPKQVRAAGQQLPSCVHMPSQQALLQQTDCPLGQQSEPHCSLPLGQQQPVSQGT